MVLDETESKASQAFETAMLPQLALMPLWNDCYPGQQVENPPYLFFDDEDGDDDDMNEDESFDDMDDFDDDFDDDDDDFDDDFDDDEDEDFDYEEDVDYDDFDE